MLPTTATTVTLIQSILKDPILEESHIRVSKGHLPDLPTSLD